MASWEDVARFIRSNYKVAIDEQNHLGMIFDLDGSRSQTVHLWKQVLDGGLEEWMQIESPVGRLGSANADSLLREVGGMVCGGLATTGEFLVLRHSVPLANVDINEIERPLKLVLASADRLERIFVGGDEF